MGANRWSAVLLVLAIVEGNAAADVPKSHGKADAAHYSAGVKKQNGGDFVAALAEFEAIAEPARTYDSRLHIASCKRLLGRLLDATRELEAIVDLAKADASLSPGDRAAVVDTAESDLVDIRAKLGHVVIKRAPSAESMSVTIDGLDAAAEVAVDPGTHVVTATLQGKVVFRRDVVVDPGKRVEVEVTAPAAPASPHTPEPLVKDTAPTPRHDSRRTLAWVSMGGGVVFLAGATVAFIQRSSAISAFQDSCNAPGAKACDDSLRSPVRTWEAVAFTSAGLSAVGFALGAYLFATSPSSPTVALNLRHGATMEIGWRF